MMHSVSNMQDFESQKLLRHLPQCLMTTLLMPNSDGDVVVSLGLILALPTPLTLLNSGTADPSDSVEFWYCRPTYSGTVSPTESVESGIATPTLSTPLNLALRTPLDLAV